MRRAAPPRCPHTLPRRTSPPTDRPACMQETGTGSPPCGVGPGRLVPSRPAVADLTPPGHAHQGGPPSRRAALRTARTHRPDRRPRPGRAPWRRPGRQPAGSHGQWGAAPTCRHSFRSTLRVRPGPGRTVRSGPAAPASPSAFRPPHRAGARRMSSLPVGGSKEPSHRSRGALRPCKVSPGGAIRGPPCPVRRASLARCSGSAAVACPGGRWGWRGPSWSSRGVPWPRGVGAGRTVRSGPAVPGSARSSPRVSMVDMPPDRRRTTMRHPPDGARHPRAGGPRVTDMCPCRAVAEASGVDVQRLI